MINEHKKGFKAKAYPKKSQPVKPATNNPVAKAAQKVAKGSGPHGSAKNVIPRKEKHKKAPEMADEGIVGKVRAANYDRLSKRSYKQADKTKPGQVSVYDVDKMKKGDERAAKAKELSEDQMGLDYDLDNLYESKLQIMLKNELTEVFDGDEETGTTHKGGKVTKKDGITRHEKTDYDDGNGQKGRPLGEPKSRHKMYPVPDAEVDEVLDTPQKKAAYIKANTDSQVQHASSQSFKSGKAGDGYNKSDAWDRPTTNRQKGMDRVTSRIKETLDGGEEYNDEVGMIRNDLHTMVRCAAELNEILKRDENVAEWVQEKIAVAKSMMVTILDYVASEHELGNIPRNK